ncbi:MAG: hypothetical protein ACLUER_01690 [Odoribacter splanchnicus]
MEQVVVKASPYRKTVETPVSIQRIELRRLKNPGGNRDFQSSTIHAGVLSSPAFRNDFVVRGGGPA